MSFVITARSCWSLMRRQSASTSAVFPDPTGPPTPILSGFGIMSGRASRPAGRGAYRRSRSPGRSSRDRRAPRPPPPRPAAPRGARAPRGGEGEGVMAGRPARLDEFRDGAEHRMIGHGGGDAEGLAAHLTACFPEFSDRLHGIEGLVEGEAAVQVSPLAKP